MKQASTDLLEDLKTRTTEVLKAAEEMAGRPLEDINQKPSPEKWSALECLEHLNKYGDFYLPEIRARLKEANPGNGTTFKSGFLGNKFALMMLPGAKPMQTFKNMNPSISGLRKNVLDEFIAQQKEMLELIDDCQNYKLTKIKTSISISKWIKLKLGDTLRVVIYHNQRHLEQAKNALAFVKATEIR